MRGPGSYLGGPAYTTHNCIWSEFRNDKMFPLFLSVLTVVAEPELRVLRVVTPVRTEGREVKIPYRQLQFFQEYKKDREQRIARFYSGTKYFYIKHQYLCYKTFDIMIIITQIFPLLLLCSATPYWAGNLLQQMRQPGLKCRNRSG